MAFSQDSQVNHSDLSSYYTSFNTFIASYGGSITQLTIPAQGSEVVPSNISNLNTKITAFKNDTYLGTQPSFWVVATVPNTGDLLQASSWTNIGTTINNMSQVQCRNTATNSYGTTACNPQSCSSQGTCKPKSCSSQGTCSPKSCSSQGSCNPKACGSQGSCNRNCDGQYSVCTNSFFTRMGGPSSAVSNNKLNTYTHGALDDTNIKNWVDGRACTVTAFVQNLTGGMTVQGVNGSTRRAWTRHTLNCPNAYNGAGCNPYSSNPNNSCNNGSNTNSNCTNGSNGNSSCTNGSNGNSSCNNGTKACTANGTTIDILCNQSVKSKS